jgi:hypothetical protein
MKAHGELLPIHDSLSFRLDGFSSLFSIEIYGYIDLIGHDRGIRLGNDPALLRWTRLCCPFLDASKERDSVNESKDFSTI